MEHLTGPFVFFWGETGQMATKLEGRQHDVSRVPRLSAHSFEVQYTQQTVVLKPLYDNIELISSFYF